MTAHVLTLRCDNRPGIVAAVASRLARHGGDIFEAAQFDDALTGKFFMRVGFAMDGADRGLRERAGRGDRPFRPALDAARRPGSAAGC